MKTYHTRVTMDSGSEYIIEEHPDDFLNKITDTNGAPMNRFVHFNKITLMPIHIASIQNVEVNNRD